jgi:hypothetical protein
MKTPLAALGIAALLIFAPALAQATDYVWDGSQSTAWSYVGPPPTFLNNWDVPGYPDDYGDRATVASKTGSYWPVLDANYTIGLLTFANGTSASPVQITTDNGTARTLTLDATTYSGKLIVTDTDSECYVKQLGSGTIWAEGGMDIIAGDSADEDAVFELSAGTLDVSSTLLVQAAHSVAADAMLYVSGGTCEPGTLDFQGSGSSSYGYAIGQFDADTTVDTSTTADGFVVIDIDADMTLQPKATTIGSTAHATDVQIGYASSPGTGTFQPTTLTIKGGDGSGEYAILRHTSGTLDTQTLDGTGKLLIEEGTYSTDHSDYGELTVSSGTTATPEKMEMKGDARLDLDADMTVSGEFRITEAYSADPTIDLAANVTLTVGSIVIDGGTNGVVLQPTFASGSSIQAN